MGRFSPTVIADSGPGIDFAGAGKDFASAMIATRAQKQKQAQLDAENKRADQEASDRHSQFSLGMQKEGYTEVGPDDPALAGTPSPFRIGNYQQTGISDEDAERNRVIARRAALSQGLADFRKSGDPTEAYTADPEKAPGLIEAVQRGQDYDARARGTGYWERPDKTVNPIKGEKNVTRDGRVWYTNPVDGSSIPAMGPDGKQLMEAPPGQRGIDGMTDLQRQQKVVGGQIDDTRSDLARAEREGAPAMKRPLEATPYKTSSGKVIPADPTAVASFVADSSMAANRINKLQSRSDSLTAVNDNLASRLAGGRGVSIPRPAPLAPPAPTAINRTAPVPGSPEAYQAEMNGLHDLATKAAAEGTPEAEINKALANAAARINKKYRRPQ